jgi:hypothetical protein
LNTREDGDEDDEQKFQHTDNILAACMLIGREVCRFFPTTFFHFCLRKFCVEQNGLKNEFAATTHAFHQLHFYLMMTTPLAMT